MIDCLSKGLRKLIEIFFIQEYLVFYIAFKLLLTLGDCYVKILTPRSVTLFNIKEIGSFPCSYSLREDFLSFIIWITHELFILNNTYKLNKKTHLFSCRFKNYHQLLVVLKIILNKYHLNLSVFGEHQFQQFRPDPIK